MRVLAEELVDFRRELSALVARSPSGQAAAYPVVASTQLDGICHEVDRPRARPRSPRWPGRRRRSRCGSPVRSTSRGILAVELFETTDGRILVNELAMRPHNTGHWTQDGAVTSQFENHLRAVMDLPLGSPAPRALDRDGEHPRRRQRQRRLYDGLPHAMARDPHLRVHLYGKELRPGRKVGHVNAYGDDLDDCLERARHAAAWFRGDLGNESE